MERKLNKLPHCQVEAIVTFNKQEWTDANQKAFNKEKQNVTVKGFRKGKAPDAMLAEHVDQHKVMDEAINSLLPNAFTSLIEEEKITPVVQPTVSVEEMDNEHLTIKFVITTEPEIELGEYKNLNIGKKEAVVTDEMVNDEIVKLAGENATLKVVDREVKNGDTAVIDFKGFVGDEAFEGGEAANYELVIGSHSFIPGFEEQIIGHKTGESFDINVKFPEQYAPNLAGKDARFAITLHEVKEKILPELNDEFVKSLDIKDAEGKVVETVDGLKEYEKVTLTRTVENNNKTEYFNKLFETIVNNSKIDLPEAMIDAEVNDRKQQFNNRLAQSGLTLEQYMQYTGLKEEQFNAQFKEQTIKDANVRTVLKEVAKKENIVVDDAVVEFEFAKIAEQYKMKVEDVKKALGGNIEGMKFNMLLQQAEDFLFNNNN